MNVLGRIVLNSFKERRKVFFVRCRRTNNRYKRDKSRGNVLAKKNMRSSYLECFSMTKEAQFNELVDYLPCDRLR